MHVAGSGDPQAMRTGAIGWLMHIGVQLPACGYFHRAVRHRDAFNALIDTMKIAVAVLREADVTFMLGGSMAAWARGGPEPDNDLDLMVRPDHAEMALSTDGGQTFSKVGEWAAMDKPKVRTGAGSVWIVFNNNDLEAAGAKVSGLGSVGTFGATQVITTAPASPVPANSRSLAISSVRRNCGVFGLK